MDSQQQSGKVTDFMAVSAAQLRAARALLGWSQNDLSAASKVAAKTIADFEREARTPYDRTLDALQRALEAAGVEFTEDDGRAGVQTRSGH